MSELKQAFEQVIWQVLQKHYNIDKREPRVLTYKHVVMKDPVGEIATQVAAVAEELVRQAISQVARGTDTDQATRAPNEDTEGPLDTSDEDYYNGWYGSE